jgi:hypothetical protein
MPARSKRAKALRLILFAGLFVLELSLIAVIFVPFGWLRSGNSPVQGHWEQEFPFSNSSWLPLAGIGAIAIVIVFAIANIGLLFKIWQAVRELNANE